VAASTAAAAASAAMIPHGRKWIAWHTRLGIPVGLAPRRASTPGAGRTCELIFGQPGLRYLGPWTDRIQHGYLIVIGITNPGRSTVRSGDFSSPLTFAFPGQEIHAARLLHEPHGRPPGRVPRVPVVQALARDSPGADRAARAQLTGDFLLRPGDSYSLQLVLTGTPAGTSRRLWHEGSLTRGKIIPPPLRESMPHDDLAV
jgi:hypothetical protein